MTMMRILRALLFAIGFYYHALALAEEWIPVWPAGTLMKAQEASKNALVQEGVNNGVYGQNGNGDLLAKQQLPQNFPQSLPQNFLQNLPQNLPHNLPQQPAFVAVAQGAEQLQKQQVAFVVQMLRNSGLNILADLVSSVQMPELFAQAGVPKTILAASDDAFSLLPSALLSRIRSDPSMVARLLRYHVVPGNLPAEGIVNDLVVDTFQPGVRVRFNVYRFADSTRVTANGALVSRLNGLSGPNFLVHILDKVLFPFPRGDMTSTLFAKNCTLYHGMTTALAASGLEDFFSASGPGESFTLFVPTTQAFQFVPQKNLSRILADSDKVSAFVLSHAVNGTFYSQGLRDGQWLTTVSRFRVPIWVGVVSEGNSRRLDSVNGQVRILQADIPVDNGVIHLIDRPINPTELVDLFRCESEFI